MFLHRMLTENFELLQLQKYQNDNKSFNVFFTFACDKAFPQFEPQLHQ